jgi:AraC-like DNA-binding protein
MYMRPLPEGQSFFIYNPKDELKAGVGLPHGKRLIAIKIRFERLHRLFMPDGEESEEIPFLGRTDMQRPIYDQRAVDAGQRVILDSLWSKKLSTNALRVAQLGYVLELLGHYFHTSEPDTAACPFLKDEDNLRRIHDAKAVILDQWQDPPTIKQLADRVGLNEYRLKAGFKEVYGNTVYGYVMDTRLNHARRMLDQGRLRVNEVAFEIGYQNPSHFIAAFKRKFGVTPKKYTKAEAN